MQQYSGRPHWAKAHSLTAQDIRHLYPQFDNLLAGIQPPADSKEVEKGFMPLEVKRIEYKVKPYEGWNDITLANKGSQMYLLTNAKNSWMDREVSLDNGELQTKDASIRI